MKKDKKYFNIIFINFIFLFNYVNGQVISEVSYFAPSPNASSLIKTVNIPVDNSTGVANLSIPMYTINVGAYKMPVSLNYHASGIRIQEYASWVGLGWQLSAGGMITRVVKGLPDDDENGICGTNNIGNKLYESYTNDYFKKINNNEWDAEPDFFYYSIPGMNGKFFFTNNKEIVQMPYNNLIITPFFSSGKMDYFKIIDTNGNIYWFGSYEQAKETTSSKLKKDSDDKTKTYTSTWHLTKIEIGNSSKEITFNYIKGSEINMEYERYVMSVTPRICSGTCEDLECEDLTNEISVEPSYLFEISFNAGSVSFISQQIRSDLLGGNVLKYVIIYGQNNEQKRYVFNYRYFNDFNGQSNARLCLDRLEEMSGNINIPPYKFYYNEDINLPPRNSVSFDHWGYFNKNTSESCIYSQFDRSPDFDRTKANVLKKIELPTGGYKELEYELNDYGENLDAGGLRIKRIKIYDGNKSYTTTYKYLIEGTENTSGELFDEPKYSISFYVYWCIPYSINGIPAGCIPKTLLGTIYQTISLNDISDFGSNHVRYNTVSVEKEGYGREQYKYTSFTDRPDIFNELFDHEGDAVSNPENYSSSSFVPNTSKFWERGLIKELKQYDEHDNLIRKLSYQYNYDIISYQTPSMFGIKPFAKYMSNGDTYFYGGRYSLISENVGLYSVTELIYDPSNPGNNNYSFSNTKYYYYNDYGQLQELKDEQSDGSTFIKEYIYPQDFNIETIGWENEAGNIIPLQKSKNIHVPILEKTRSVGTDNVSKVIDATYYKYSTNQLNKPSEIYKYENTASLGNISMNDILESDFHYYSKQYIFGGESCSEYHQGPACIFETDNNIFEGADLEVYYDIKVLCFGSDVFELYIDPWYLGNNGFLITNTNYPNGFTSFNKTITKNVTDGFIAPSMEIMKYGANTASVANIFERVTSRTYDLTIPNYFKKKVEYKYDSYGNVVQEQNTNDIPVSYFWAYNGAYPVVKAVNTTSSELNGAAYYAYTGSDMEDVTEPSKYTSQLTDLRNFSNYIRGTLPNAQVYIYTYKPLVGMTSETGPNGKTTFYEYDDFGRLEYIKDNDLNIIDQYNYHYQNQ